MLPEVKSLMDSLANSSAHTNLIVTDLADSIRSLKDTMQRAREEAGRVCKTVFFDKIHSPALFTLWPVSAMLVQATNLYLFVLNCLSDGEMDRPTVACPLQALVVLYRMLLIFN